MSAARILDRRTSGLLLHPTSLPSKHGIGDLGAEARTFIDFLASAEQSWWQMLPVTPPSWGDSPYTSVSAFAGNPLLVDLRGLVADGLLTEPETRLPSPPGERVDYGWVWEHKRPLLDRAFSRFKGALEHRSSVRESYEKYLKQEKKWLDDYALFMALHQSQGHKAWTEWPKPLRDREKEALKSARQELAPLIEYHCFVQWAFDKQWAELKRYAADHGVSLLGDLPIFVALDSADVWAHRGIFKLDPDGKPKVVAGVPPDYFSADGQLWGNPLYDWEALEERDFDWWIDRISSLLGRFDAVRIDHFIGFYRAWHVPAGAPNAREGEWVAGPRARFFKRVRKHLGELPIVAEDLGAVTPEVWELRDRFAFPGMRVLQFGFGGPSDSEHLPHTYVQNAVVYTGTHDNDTTVGWWRSLSTKMAQGGAEGHGAAHARAHAVEYLGGEPEKIHWAMIRLAMMSPANTAIFPVQDLLGLGGEARMNVPGVAGGNWSWRLAQGALDPSTAGELRRLVRLYGRKPKHA
jgi:4-alpha-glucanotransferase